MSNINEKLDYIRKEIESDLTAEESVILSDPHKIEFSSLSDNNLTIEEMRASRDKNNYTYQVDYDNILSDCSSGPKSFFKRMIHKLIGPVIAPVVLKQNIFNSTATTSINQVSDNVTLLSYYLEEQRKINKELQREILSLSAQVNQLYTENSKLRAELIRSTKKSQHKMSILLDVIENKNGNE